MLAPIRTGIRGSRPAVLEEMRAFVKLYDDYSPTDITITCQKMYVSKWLSISSVIISRIFIICFSFN